MDGAAIASIVENPAITPRVSVMRLTGTPKRVTPNLPRFILRRDRRKAALPIRLVPVVDMQGHAERRIAPPRPALMVLDRFNCRLQRDLCEFGGLV